MLFFLPRVAADPLESAVATLLATQDDIAKTQSDIVLLSQEATALTEKRIAAEAALQSSSLANQNALDALASMETLASNAWTRVPLSLRSSRKGTVPTAETSSPESRIVALRRSLAELQKLHGQFLYGQDFVPTGAQSPNSESRILCDILTLGLSCAIALSKDGSCVAVAIPAPDETWSWIPAPSRLPEIRTAISAYKNYVPLLHFPLP